MPRIVDHNERRRELLRTTWTMLARVGFEGATMRGIAREAGYSTGVLTHYFRNKEDILAAAIELTAAEARERRQTITGALHGFEALRAVAIDLLPDGEQSIERWAAWVCFWGRGVANPMIAKAHLKYYKESRDAFVALLNEAGERGEVRRGIDTEHEAETLMALLYGLAVHVLLNKMERHRPLKVLDRYLDNVLAKPQA